MPMLAILAAAVLPGCSTASSKAAGFTEAPIPALPLNAAVVLSEKPLSEKPSPFPDRNIARDLDLAFLRNRLDVTYEVSNHVVTLTGVVSSQSKRSRAEKVAAAVANVQQVVNELLVKPRQFGSGKP